MLNSPKSEFTPTFITRMAEGYDWADLRADALAGLTVAIVALPLSMAIAIASGVGPERGLYTAIIGGFLVSLLGGSRFQIGGPAGAFIVLVSACVAQIGLNGLILATLLSGVMLIGLGMLRAGNLVRLIPHAVTLGFSAGIAVIIFVSQITDLTGITLAQDAPAVADKLAQIWAARASLSPAALGLAVCVIAAILALRRFAPRWPSILVAVVGASIAAFAFGLPVETIYQRFGELPRTPPAPHIPALSPDLLCAALPWAVQFMLLGAIESLLSAVVADTMSGQKHRPNAELVAQGVANIGSALFGGFCVTGTIARTATNVRAGARSPVAGMLHAVFVLIFLAVAAPLAGYIPLAALAGVLALVAWNMAERAEIWHLMRSNIGQGAVLLVTFGFVLLWDLSAGIFIGTGMAALITLLQRRARG
jgi:SulP family sulfate permease